MRILDKYKDYYDYALSGYVQPNEKGDICYKRNKRKFMVCEYVRTMDTVVVDEQEVSPSFKKFLVKAIGGLPVFSDILVTCRGLRIYGPSLDQFNFSQLDVDQMKEDIESLKNSRNLSQHWLYSQKVERLKEFVNNYDREDVLQELCREMDSPIFLISAFNFGVNLKLSLRTNPILSNEFPVHVLPDPVEMYSEVESGLIHIEDMAKELAEVSEPEIIEKKGFDKKTSFRKRN